MSHGKYIIGSLAVLVGATVVVGCGTHDKASTSGAAPSAASATSSSPAAPANYDISRIGAVKEALSGYDAMDLPVDTVEQKQLDAPGVGALSTAPPSVVTPAECAVLLKPLAPVGVGARAQGLMADKSPHTIVVMAAQSDKPATEIGRAGCEHITITAPDGVNASIDQVPGPDIPGVKTVGLRAHVITPDRTTDESTYTAALGDRTIVVVQGDVDQAMAAAVLGKAATALRG
jgi:hypothetical protein